MKIKGNKDEIDKLAAKYGFELIDYQENIGLCRYYKLGVKINVYLSKICRDLLKSSEKRQDAAF